MTIDRVSIRRFKSVEELTLELGQVNVLVGPNGVGKSNILEAIGMSAAALTHLDDASLLRKGLRLSHPTSYISRFRDGLEDLEITLCAAHEECRLTLQHDATQWKVSRDEPASEPLRQALAQLERYKIYTPDTQTLRGLIVDTRQDDPIGLAGGRLADAVQDTRDALGEERWAEVVDTLREMLDWLGGVGVAPATQVPMSRSIPTTPYVLRFEDRYMVAGHNLVSGYDASEGALFVLFMLVLSLHPRAPRCFAVDNFDHGLNPRLARRLIQEASEWILRDPERQAILTAHNPAVLDGLRLQDDRIRLFTVDRSSSGKTTARRIQVNEELLAKAQEGWSLSRMWLAGFLGGVPDV
jgi:predicted ATPase